MPYYAYEDEERTTEVFAENVRDDNKLEYYFCPTKNCAARMTIRNINGNNDRAAYFAANPTAPHSDFCRIGNYSNTTRYDEQQFDFNNFMNDLMNPNNQNNRDGHGNHGDGNGQTIPISTVRQLYLVCIQRSIHQFYNGVKISDLLIDRRTRHIYFNYIRGMHLVECKFWRYEENNNTYYAKYGLDDNNNQYLKIKLVCQTEELFKKLYKRIVRNSFVVAGNWEMRRDACEVNIVNCKQVYKLPD